MLCKKLGWKEPPVFSDMGSSVYSRRDACVTSSEYTNSLVNWLQLQCEGRIVAKANFDWRSTIENARICWLQKQRDNTKIKVNITSVIKTAVEESVALQIRNISSKLDKTIEIQEQLVEVIVESLKSAKDVGQIVHKRINNRKLRKSQLDEQHKFILSDGSTLPLPSPESAPTSDSTSESEFALKDLTKGGKKRPREKSKQGKTYSASALRGLTNSGYKRTIGRSSKGVTCKRSRNEKFALIDGCSLPLPSPEP